MKTIASGMLQVCSKCQNNCNKCVTTIIRKNFPDYQLSIEQLENFIESNEKSGYFFRDLWLNGFGEPLLWDHLHDGLKLLSRSKSIGNIFIRSNGHIIDEDIFNYISRLSISRYKPLKNELTRLIKKFPNKTKIIGKEEFCELVGKHARIPCMCICHGPTIIGNYALVYCGPVIYSPDTTERFIDGKILKEEDVKNLNGENWVEYTKKIVGSGIVEVKLNYLDVCGPRSQHRNMQICKYCYGNNTFKRTKIRSQQ